MQEKNKFTFKKEERLNSVKDIEYLFQSSSFFVYPFKVFFFLSEETQQTLPKLLISVSKRNFKKAVDRNAVKRKTREVYRLNKHTLLQKNENTKLVLGLIYVGKKVPDFHFSEKKLNLIFQRLIK